jgi:delta24-sterol reductase
MGLFAQIWGLVFTLITPIIDYVATNYRPLAMTVVVLPLSFLMRNYLWARDIIYAKYFSNPADHGNRVQRVQDAVKARLARPVSERRKMCTARAPWQNLSTRFADYKSNSDCIFVGDFRDVLELDEKNMTVRLEPLVDVGSITAYLLPRGYMLATTLEIEEATIGGLAMAVGMTTASHKHGLLQETVSEYEVVMGDGTLVKATRDEHSDLFHCLPWSHGSLGLLVGLTLKIIPVKKYVKVVYEPVKGQAAYCARIREVSLAKEPADFIEATIFSKDEAVIMTANFCDEPQGPERAHITDLTGWYKKWFYTYVRDMLLCTAPHYDYVPTHTYIFRHNRAVFWALRDQLPEKYGNHWLYRFFLGWLNPPKVTFLKLPATQAIRKEMMMQRVYQDIVLPLNALEDAINKATDLFGMWPLLVYPSRIYDHGADKQGQFPKPAPLSRVEGTDYGMYFDLGAYGIPVQVRKETPFKCVTSMREMEHFTRAVGGAPFLYADTFMTKAEFGEMFNLTLYEKVRAQYSAADHFPHLYDKTSGCQSFDWREELELEKHGAGVHDKASKK